MARPVMIALFSDTCPHCVKFKEKELPALRDGLGSADLVEGNIGTEGGWPKGIPEDLKKHIYGFPAFTLVHRTRWDDNLRGKKTPLDPEVFNGKVEGGKVVYNPVYPMSADSIIKWANSTRPKPYVGKDKKVTLSHKGSKVDTFVKSSQSYE